ncbi:adenylate/guanylate cyclase domain-containing protein [Methylosinus sp. H3A]|uniref:adenylate/guanylate cyclase domain-containing protein n=1 Tax=Methylosinus sp. H3A TaxID=2785786 RepID=UPI0018C31153|nr:adenylate/guanylate cyclase domain-containing protein [Methylosinus sp. H3A]MBG0812496.1 adenylate/guanylate cyclase domain-containing protein [Methylosinus sp. H3A]
MQRKIAAILAADVAQYSRLVAEDEEDALARLASSREVFDEFVGKAGGRVFNTAGDAVFAEFPSAVEAVRCAIDIQESLRTQNLGVPQRRQMLFRIGVTIGDVVERDGDLLGDGVNIAARLEGLAEPGGICVSRSVFEQVGNKISVPFRDIGAQEVKNIPQPVHAFVVDMAGTVAGEWRRAPGSRLAPPPKPAPRWRTPAAAAGVFLIAAAAALTFTKHSGGPAFAPVGLSPSDSAEAYAVLAKSGGVVQDARTAPELYHNARTFEARGDAASARRDYLALAELGTEALDAHLRFAALLRAQDGRAGAREAYDRLREATGSGAAALVHATLFDGAERRRRIEAFVAARPDFSPAQMLLADEYSDDRVGAQTIGDRRKEKAALAAFLAADAEGGLTPFFLDHSALAEWLERARRRHAALEAEHATARGAPAAQFMRSNAGWTVSVSLPEPAVALAWRLGETGEFSATGETAAIDQRTGRLMPNLSFDLPPDTPPSTLWIKYEDASSRAVGPFPVSFDPHRALVDGHRDLLERFWNNWAAFSPDGRLVYYTQLMSYRCAIAKAELGFDDKPPTVLPMPPCDERNPYSIPADAAPYLKAPAGLKAVSVRLTYSNGEQSKARVFRRQ